MDHDDLIKSEECQERAAHCASAADRTSNEHVRQLLQSMQKIGLRLATETERVATAKRLAMQRSQQEQTVPNEPASGNAPVGEARTMITSGKPTSRLLANAPLCSRCNTTMKVRTLRPGRKVDVVAYRCEDCGEEVVVEVKRAW
jgi:hypothetical protein